MASEYHGLVTFHGLPVPGATVTVTQAGKKYVTVTDTQGFYSLPTLADGAATLKVEMTGFTASDQPVTITADAPTGRSELKLMTLDEMHAALKPVASAPMTVVQARVEPKKTSDAPKARSNETAGVAAQAPPPPPEEIAQRAVDGLLVNGSVNNAATSQFSLAARFGNTASGKSLYNFSVNMRADVSALDARSYSISGFNTSKPQTSAITGGFAVQGPLKIPHVLRNGPNIFVGYQRTRDSVAISTPGLVPDLAVRSGDFSHEVDALGKPVVVIDPTTGKPYPGNKVPISPQAQALLALYPLPNVAGNALYNYQIPLVTDTHVDGVNANANKTVGRKNQFFGSFGLSSTRASNGNLFNFVDTTHVLGMRSEINWSHTFNAHLRSNVSYQFSRQSTRLTPFSSGRTDVSGLAGITGNDRDPAYWGPPTLEFSGGLSGLGDGPQSFIRNATNGISVVGRLNRTPHNITAGVDFRRQQFNYLTQQNPRGTFQFTSLGSTGSDIADFLIGRPDASSLAFGNADKYLRQSVAAIYATDDWRLTPQLTVNIGARWEYGSPVNEIKNRLVNLDVAPGFSAVAPLLASAPVGTLTGQHLPGALLRADLAGIQPRVGVSWRPIPGSSMLVSAGYGLNFDSSVYQGIAVAMTQQFPLSKSVILQNSAACPLTLANGFAPTLANSSTPCPATTLDTFGVDPNFRVGYLHTWNLKVQRDLPGSLQMVATYLGNKGTRGAQQFLPNTVPFGAINPCPTCPVGFEYLTSNGNSTRESGQLQLRRRLKSGFTASVLYTWSKSIDDDSSLGGQGAATSGSARIAQDWRNLNGERGLSGFDQRHLVNFQMQYTTGMGKGGGTLLSGWRGRVYKEWTVQTQINAGTGLPETPLQSATLIAGRSAFVRPNVTGADIYAGSGGGFLNRGAYSAPALGQWGNARRNSITGPGQFSLNMALVRTFRLDSRFNLDAQITAANALNHVTYTGYVTNINSTQFGLPAAANTMRTLQTSLRLRF